jgi:hypothetical protein
MLSRLQGHSSAGSITSMRNSNNNIGNRTRELPTCSAVPQATALLLAPYSEGVGLKKPIQDSQMQCILVIRHPFGIAGVANMWPSREIFATHGQLNSFENTAEPVKCDWSTEH